LERDFSAPASSWDDLEAEFAPPPSPPRRGVVRDVLGGVGRGLARSGYRTAIGLADLVGADGTADRLRTSRDEADAFYRDSETTAGKVAAGAAGFAGDAAQFATPGGLLNRIAKLPAFAKSLPGLAKVAAPATAKGRVARDLVLNAPVNLAAGIQREESAAGNFAELLDSDRLRAVADNTGGRLAFELALDAGAGGLVEAAAGALAKRGAKRAGARADALREDVLTGERARVDGMREQTPAIRGGMDRLDAAESTAKASAASDERLSDQVAAVLARRDAVREAAQAKSRETFDLAKAHDEELLRAARTAKDPDELRYPMTNSVRDALARFQQDVGKAAQRRAPAPEVEAPRAPEPTPIADPFPRSSPDRRTISRTEFGPVDTPEAMTAARDRARDYLMTLRGKAFTNQATGLKAEIRKSAIGKARHHSSTPEKVAAMRVLDELIEDAEPVMLDVPPRGKGSTTNVEAYHYFTADAVVDGKPQQFRLTLTEERAPKGAQARRVFYWDLDINDPSKSSKGSLGPAPTAPVTDPAVDLPGVPGVTRQVDGPTSRVADPASVRPGAPATSRPLGETTSLDVDPARGPGRPATSRSPDETIGSGPGAVNAADLMFPDVQPVREVRRAGRVSWEGGDAKFRRTGTEELEAMHRRLADEYQALALEEQNSITPWTRYDDDVAEQRSGIAKGARFGRAKAGANQVYRQLERVEAELAGRYNALDPDEIGRRPTYAFGESGGPYTRELPPPPEGTEDLLFGGLPTPLPAAAVRAASDNLLGGAAGATAGMVADEENPLRGAATGFTAGALGQAGLKALLHRADAAGQLVRRPADRGAAVAAPARTYELPPSRWQPPSETPAAPTPTSGAVDPADVDADEFFNFRRAMLDPSGEAVLREEVQRVAATQGLAPKGRETHATVIARSLGIDPEDIAPQAGERLGRDKLLAVRNRIVTNADAIAEGRKRLDDRTLAPDQRAIVERGVQALERQQEHYLGMFIRQRSEAGRDLAALRILAARTTDPAVWLSRAMETAGRPLTSDEHLAITRLANEGKAEALARQVAAMREATLAEKGTTLLKAALLTAPKTHLANLVGNTSMAMLETAKDAPAMLVDRMLIRLAQVVSKGRVTGQATKHFDPAAQVRASVAGAKRGLEEARAVMQGVPIEGALQKYDFSRETNFDNAILDGFTKTVFRALQAGDRIFYGAAFQRSLTEQATLLAKREGLAGDALAARVADLSDLRQGAKSVTDDMVLQAMADAEVATFTNRGLLADLGSRAKGVLSDRGGSTGRVVGEVLMPFVRTPANVVSRTVEYSPLGALGTIPDVWRLVEKAMQGAPALAEQRRIADRLGRSVVGSSTAIVAGAMLASKDRMTGTFPTDQRTRDQWAAEGKIPNAVRLGDRWYSMERISPLGNLMAIGASLVHHLRENLDPLREELDPLDPTAAAGLAGVQAVGDIGKYAMEQSFLQGVNRSLDAVRDPSRGAMSFVENVAGMTVPSVVGAVARAVDPVQRETEGVVDAVTARIPGLSKTLPAKIDRFGEPITRDGGATAALLDFTNSRRDRTADDPIAAELQRLGVTITRRKRQGDESPQQFERRLREEGQILRAVVEASVSSPEYADLPAQLDAGLDADPRLASEYPPGSAARRRLVEELQRTQIEDAVKAARSHFTRLGLGRAEVSP
jgi:hypothetical protein